MPPHGKIVVSEEQEAWFRKWFPEVENSRLMKASGLTHDTLHRLARARSLKKSAKGLAGIKKRQATDIKKVCEKNGYYASMRGKAPCKACRDAWEEYRRSVRYKPAIAILRDTNPRKFKKYLKRRSEIQKENWRKETRRLVLGMSRKSKLKVVSKPYTKSQLCRRNNCLKFGYFLSTDHSEQGGERYIIYYDDNTQRRERFEKNCIADGFTFRYEPS
jgi:hypothetical protein